MSVIIRLQNLPWSASALDIRQFFNGLAIPEGGVHIVGGELGDAFIAFSTDEDARCAMMKDREKINETQVRLLLSSRAEMQKVIEMARQQSLLALQGPSVLPATSEVTKPAIQPPIISATALQSLLAPQLEPASTATAGVIPFLTYQQQAGIILDDDCSETSSNSPAKTQRSGVGLLESSRDARRSSSRERRRSKDRNDREKRGRRGSRDRDRERDRNNGRRRRGRSRSRSRERSSDRGRDYSSERSRDRSRDRGRRDQGAKHDKDSNNRFGGKGTEVGQKPKIPAINPWSVPPMNAYQTTNNYTVANTSNIVASAVLPTQYGALSGLNLFNGGSALDSALKSMPSFGSNAYTTVGSKESEPTAPTTVAGGIPAFLNYGTSQIASNNYSVGFLGTSGASSGSSSNSSETIKPFALQNPYSVTLQTSAQSTTMLGDVASDSTSTSLANQPMFPGLVLEKSNSSIAITPIVGLQQQLQLQEPIAFASTNPYEKMYPNLFAQAAAANAAVTPKLGLQQTQHGGGDRYGHRGRGNRDDRRDYRRGDDLMGSGNPLFDSCCLKISNLCGSITYSDIRKFFSGLIIPRNGIKMVNDKHGLRIGVAYVQFARSSSVQKALMRNNWMLKAKPIKLEAVTNEEFERIEDSYRPQNQSRDSRGVSGSGFGGNWNDTDNNGNGNTGSGGGNSNDRANPFAAELPPSGAFTVLYIEDIALQTTEHDIMKIFSSYSVYDIFLLPSPDYRRELVAYVKFSREEEALAAYEDRSRHMIGYRKVRVRPVAVEAMERAREKLRLANEQLLKEEELEEEAANVTASDNSKTKLKKKRTSSENANSGGEQNNEANLENESDESRDGSLSHSHGGSIPSIFDLSAAKPDAPSDPRLRRQRTNPFDTADNGASSSASAGVGASSGGGGGDGEAFSAINNGKRNNFNDLPSYAFSNNNNSNNSNNNNNNSQSMEDNFVILKNCDYNTRISDVAELFMSSNLRMQHIEMLRNDRQMPTGEYIVEFNDARDADIAISDFNNTQFRNRNLRIRTISPQEIANRLGTPFLNYMPGGGRNDNLFVGGGGNARNGPGGNMRFGGGGNAGGSNMRGLGGPMRGMRRNGGGSDSDMGPRGDETPLDGFNCDLGDTNARDDANTSGGIPDKFNRSGCVVTMENVPFKADMEDIKEFFSEFPLTPQDIIRRYNDDGSPTGDARVAFETPSEARAAFDAKKRKQMFNRTIFLNIL